ncbi:MotA/TolQ/ExbB proton channel family protein [Sphingomonas sp. NY01]|uniref:motility protein A n=1 Tax=Sphingomonas sp. NY01 TaxID=2968057 RepID=UPI00315CEEF3
MTALPPLDQFLDPVALAIVAGGTMLATLLRHPLADIGRALAALRTLPRRRFDGDALLGQLAALDRIARRQGVVALDRTVVADADLADAVTAIVDGQPPAAIIEGLNRAQSLRIERHVAAADVWAGMAEAAPAMGLIGTLIGLASMFATLRDPAAIGSAMAIALLATLYGALFGNLFALPIAHRLRTNARTEATERARLEAPLAALAAREAPRRAVTLASVA